MSAPTSSGIFGDGAIARDGDERRLEGARDRGELQAPSQATTYNVACCAWIKGSITYSN